MRSIFPYTCRVFKIPFGQFMLREWGNPCLYCLPYAAVLLVARWSRHFPGVAACSCGLAVGGPLLLAGYWLRVVPDSMKKKIFRKLGLKPKSQVLPGIARERSIARDFVLGPGKITTVVIPSA